MSSNSHSGGPGPALEFVKLNPSRAQLLYGPRFYIQTRPKRSRTRSSQGWPNPYVPLFTPKYFGSGFSAGNQKSGSICRLKLMRPSFYKLILRPKPNPWPKLSIGPANQWNVGFTNEILGLLGLAMSNRPSQIGFFTFILVEFGLSLGTSDRHRPMPA